MTKTPTQDTAAELQELDAATQYCFNHIDSLAAAVKALSSDRKVRDLADQIQYWATDSMAGVSLFATKFGCDHKPDLDDRTQSHSRQVF